MLTCVFQQNTKQKWYWKYKDISFGEHLTDKIALLSIASLACWVHRKCQGCNLPNMAGSAQTGLWVTWRCHKMRLPESSTRSKQVFPLQLVTAQQLYQSINQSTAHLQVNISSTHFEVGSTMKISQYINISKWLTIWYCLGAVSYLLRNQKLAASLIFSLYFLLALKMYFFAS